MKLASYKDGSRDGQLVVVSRDLHLAVPANGIAGRLQAVLDDWNFLAPQLQDLAHTLNHGKARHAFPFDPAMCLAPLPRAPRRLSPAVGGGDASRHALVAGTADWALGATQDLVVDPVAGAPVPTLQWAVVTGDIAAGSGADAALEGIRLVGLLVDWTVAADGEAAPSPAAPSPAAPSPTTVLTTWAPVLVTLDELDGAWQRGRLALQLERRRNAARAVRTSTADAATPPLGPLLAAAARHRPVTAGTVLSSGALGNTAADPTPEPWGDGDRLQAQALAADGHSMFGLIDQTVVAHG